jgi:hypothetical protein
VTAPSARTLGMTGIGVVLLAALVMLLNDETSGTGMAPQARSADSGITPSDAPVVDVRLEALQRSWPEIVEAQRNLFRFESRQVSASPPPLAAPAGPLPVPGPAAVLETPDAGPVGPPDPPPIPMKVIGVVGPSGPEGQVVFFSDGLGHVFFGREGDIIEGRYRVLKVSPDAAELAYLDGRGRQTIRLSGQ